MYRTYKIHLTKREMYYYYINFILFARDRDDRINLRKLKNKMCEKGHINFIKLMR